MPLSETTVSPPEDQFSRKPGHSITHGTPFRQSTPHLDSNEDKLRSPFEYQRVLVLGGEDIRQLVSLYILKDLMEMIVHVEKEQDARVDSSSHSPLVHRPTVDGGFRFCHYFDYICGISGGGIAAILLGRMRYTINEAIVIMQQVWMGQHTTIYQFSRSQSPDARRSRSPLQIIRQWLKPGEVSQGDTTVSRDTPPEVEWLDPNIRLESVFGMCRALIITSRAHERGSSVTPFVFRSYEILDPGDRDFRNSDQETHLIPIRDVCQVTIASPTSPWKSRVAKLDGLFHDGVTKVPDPCLEAYREITAWHKEAQNPFEFIMNIEIDPPKHSSSRSWNPFAGNPLGAATYTTLGTIPAEDQVHFTPFFNPGDVKGRAPDIFKHLEKSADVFCKGDLEQKKLWQWAHKLVAARKRRAGFERWEAFAFGVFYKCCICEDSKTNSGFMDAETWGLHMVQKHQTAPFMVEERCRVMAFE